VLESRRARFLVLISSVLALQACESAPEAADLVLTNGVVATVDEALPDAEAVAIRGDRIVAVGTTQEITRFIGDGTEVVDLDGRFVMPGFIESHGHYIRLGQTKMILDLTDTRSWDDVVGAVRVAVSESAPGAWIEGQGWHQEKWDAPATGPDVVDGVPAHATLSAISPNNPVILQHSSGHAAYANALAMEMSDLGDDTPDPPGGTIVRDASGHATGLLRENADALVYDVMRGTMAIRSESERWQEFDRQVQLAAQEALSKGVTTFHDAGSDFATIDGLKRLADEGRLPIRLYVMIRYETNESMAANLGRYRMIGYGDNHLTVRAIKRQLDGALGSHGAWLLEPYEDMGSSIGLTVETPEEVEGSARIAAEQGFQLNMHAIGDRANRVVLDIYERAFVGRPDGDQMRWRIEHAQHLHPDDVQRFADLGIIAAMQGVHATSDAPWIYARLGADRAASGAYLWRSLMDVGVVIANGTDVPVEDISPVASFYSSVVRQDKSGRDFFPDQRMTRMEALRSYTINNAYAGFEEADKGSITVGKLADIAILDRNLMTVPDEELPGARVEMTIVGGQILYRAGN